MKMNFAALSLIVLTSVSSFAANCDFRITEPFDKFNSSTKEEIVQVMNSKGYVYNESSIITIDLSTSSDLIGWSNNAWVGMTAYVPLEATKMRPWESNAQCGIVSEHRPVGFLGGKNATVKKIIKSLEIPNCKQLPAVIQACINSFQN